MSTSGTVMTRAASHLNDNNQLVYTPTVLLPYLNMALEELEEELGVFELSPLKRDSIPIDVSIGDTSLAEMPVDFVEVITLYERPQGSSQDWVPINEGANVNLNLINSDSVIQWAVRGAEILINPPTSDREVLLEYIGGLTPAVNDGVALDIEASRRFLGLLTARNAARDLGNSPTKANTYEKDIDRARDRLIRRMQKNAQGTMGVRRLPYQGRVG